MTERSMNRRGRRSGALVLGVVVGLVILVLLAACASEPDSPGRYEGAGKKDWPSIVTVEFCQAAAHDLTLSGEVLLRENNVFESESVSLLLSIEADMEVRCKDRPEVSLAILCKTFGKPYPEHPAIRASFQAWRADWCWAVE